VGVLERRWPILLALLILALVACRPADPDLELTAREAALQSPPAPQGASESPLAAPATGHSPIQTPAVALQSPIQPPAVATRAAGAQPAAPAAQAGSVPLIILHTNDTWGYYDPCG
jgi:2',3'-cyclic-nucleotide 2'-phosphodiesterase (5'-nucleotidase family)